jgi:hypothetical protein
MYSTKQIHLLLIMKAPPLSSKIWQKIAECLLRYGSTDGLCNSSLIILSLLFTLAVYHIGANGSPPHKNKNFSPQIDFDFLST